MSKNAVMATANPTPSSDTPIAIKLALNNGENRRFKLALRELGANTLPDKVSFHSGPSSYNTLPVCLILDSPNASVAPFLAQRAANSKHYVRAIFR